jgi:hypothetical protein
LAVPSARNAEVGELDQALARQHDVRRLDVAMNHPLAVRETQPFERLAKNGDHLAGQHGPAQLPEVLRQGLSLDELHHDVELSLLDEEFANLDDVGVLKVALDFGLVEEPLPQFGVERQLRIDGLDGDDFVEDSVHAAENNAHAAARDFSLEAVTGDLFGHLRDHPRTEGAKAGFAAALVAPIITEKAETRLKEPLTASGVQRVVQTSGPDRLRTY